MGDFKDYDAFDAEESTPVIRVRGREWTLPSRGEVPARTIVRFERLRAEVRQLLASDDKTAKVPDDIIDRLPDLTVEGSLRLLVGDELVEGWFDAGVSRPVLKRLAEDAVGFYVDQADTFGAEPHPPPPPGQTANGAGGSQPQRSSNGGRSSKRTSTGSTESKTSKKSSAASRGGGS